MVTMTTPSLNSINSLLTSAFTILLSLSYTGSLTLTSLEFPSHVMLGQSTSLKCSFTRQPSQKLDSIKWYKDGREFYRLHPQDGQRREFHAQGVNIDANLTAFHLLPQTGHHTVALLHTELATTGSYRCQITEAQAPFHTEQQDKNLTIIIQPEKGSPRIQVSKDVVYLGQDAEVECWSDRSKPAANLQFFINGDRVPSDRVQDLKVSFENDGQLETSYRKMRFTVRENHFREDSLVVKCNANIGEAYWQTSQVAIRIIGKPSYMLESRSSRSNSVTVPVVLLLTPTILFQLISWRC